MKRIFQGSTLLFIVSLLIPMGLYCQVEICDNGIDDDNDSLIDLNDDDCICEVIEPVSLIPNPSFEEMDCCPFSISQLYCATDWIQASEPTTDFLHTCGFMGWDDLPPPLPFPDGEGVMGFRDGRVRGEREPEVNWKEYAGACLTRPLSANNTYRFQFDVGFIDPVISPPINISFFGTTDCENLPFGDGRPNLGCPTNGQGWEKLGDVLVSGGLGNQWVNAMIDVRPDEDIYAIAIGPDCDPVIVSGDIYYFFDNLLLADSESFELEISEVNHPCNPDFTLGIPNNNNWNYQWYLNGVALIGEVDATLSQNYGEGSYQVTILDGASCRILEAFDYTIPSYEVPANIVICEGEAYQFGNTILTESGFYLDTFPNQDGCDSIVPLQLEVINSEYDTFDVTIPSGATFGIGDYAFDEAGNYPLIFTSSAGCDSLVLLRLSDFDIYIPNAFSPNSDGINELFHPFGPPGEIQSYTMQIYDRWGNLVYDGQEWNGSDMPPNVYTYRIAIEFKNSIQQQYFGAITLVR